MIRIKIMAESADHVKIPTPEWSHKIEADEIGAKEVLVKLLPNADQKKDLCQRLDLLGIKVLSAELKLKRKNKRVIHVQGNFNADVTQKCVVSLEPVPAKITDRIEAWFADPEQAVSFARARHEKDKAHSEEHPVLEEHEDPEPIIDGQIDLGELVTQYLSLALPEYPRSEAAAQKLDEANDALPKKENPFAALSALKNKD